MAGMYFAIGRCDTSMVRAAGSTATTMPSTEKVFAARINGTSRSTCVDYSGSALLQFHATGEPHGRVFFQLRQHRFRHGPVDRDDSDSLQRLAGHGRRLPATQRKVRDVDAVSA